MIWGTTSGSVLTLVPGKIREEILLEHISGHMKEEVTGNSQHSFTKGKSHLINFKDKMTGFVNKRRTVDIIYTHFTRVFDTISLNTLVSKVIEKVPK